MARASSTSDAAGTKSDPRPTERIKPSSTRKTGILRSAAAATKPFGAREAQTAIAAPGLAFAAAKARLVVRRKAGDPAAERKKSATRRRFQNDMPTQTATRR